MLTAHPPINESDGVLEMRILHAAVRMPKREWVEAYVAVEQLMIRWDVPITMAENIVWNALQSGEVQVRGRDRVGGSMVPRNISKEIPATLRRGFLTSLEFCDVEINWKDLVRYGRNRLPEYFRQIPSPEIGEEWAAPKSRSRAKTRGIAEAINQLWPNGISKELTAKERDKRIIEWLKDNGYSIPSPRSIQRALKGKP
jgi:hypothetical protein